MIVDVLENAQKYYCINKRFKKAFEYILSSNFAEMKCGRYEIDGKDIFVNIDEYETKTEALPEYHKKYIDIQLIVEGNEKIGYCNLNELEIEENFNEEKDVWFGKGEVNYIKMCSGKFMILFPQDAHQPCMAIGNPLKVKKVVVKVKID